MVDYRELEIKLKKLAKDKEINYYELLQMYMFERILERISISKYNDNFILKGGLLLSAIFGIDNRSTKDMDATIKDIDIDKNNILKILNEILSLDINDGIKFEIIDTLDIRIDDFYGGNKYYVVARMQNLKVNLEIDISTGDIITPKELKYSYPLLLSEKKLLINSYNLESILAEKIETILKRGEYNSRMKDFYDIYLLITKLEDKLNYDILNKSVFNTFNERGSLIYLDDYENILDNIVLNERLNNLWYKYVKKRNYVEFINFEQIILLLKKFIEMKIAVLVNK